MSGEDSRVPREVSKFDAYIRTTNTRQLATNPDTSNPYWTDYGWTSAESTAYDTDWHDKWVTDLYPKHIDETLSTSPQKKKTHKFIEDFIDFTQQHHLLDKIVICGKANADDEALWHVVLVRDNPSSLTEKIEGKPIPALEHSGPGVIDVKVKGSEDQTRPSIAQAGADCVQYSYMIADTMPAEDAVLNPDSSVFTKDISKKAHFPLNLGGDKRRKWLIIYFRWYNTSFPQFAGDWSEVVMIIIG